MSLQIDTIEVTRETAEMLRAKAKAHRLSIDAYLRILVEKDVRHRSPHRSRRSRSLIGIWMHSLQGARDYQCSRATSPAADIYADHD